MSQKKLNLAIPTCLLALDVYYLYTAFTARKSKLSFIGPYEFPKILGIILAILCIIVLVQTLLSHKLSDKVVLKNLGLVGITMGAVFIFIMLWQSVGLFYVWAAVFLLALLFTYRSEDGRFTKSKIISNLVISVGTSLMTYVLFDVLMKVRL